MLPARFPNLLVNGGGGIAVGMATNIPPHNLREVIDATVHLLDHPDAHASTTSCSSSQAPDFPTGALILGRAGISEVYRTGRGSVRMRAVAEIEEGRKGGERIVVSELPYQTSVEAIGAEDRRARRTSAAIEGIRDVATTLVGRHGRPRHRPQARRQRAGGAQPALQAHADADELRREHGRAGRRRAAHC